ncbi:hypothetical protein EJV47_04600 [Hymenobacter gummosus]|uniref:Uncharacterized protein n=1 Tax=Hymenobacter gummosus TaxID=1776032 RepID=A0A431U7R8_9BACT|nr:hypothetical protein [Hymenobacter gummosus]RTQ52307.1 hypothetical protein EJV47_04600 [Hymenobacter gummosus]
MPSHAIEVAWSHVRFDEGCLQVRYCGIWLEWFRFAGAKRYLNHIRDHYTFRNAPPLRLLIHQRTVLSITNPEVVLYYIQFLTNSYSLLEWPTVAISATLRPLPQYTKAYFRTHLPDYFRPATLKHLCQVTREDAPIIPVPEVVINTKGGRTIHDSFLFTLPAKHGITYIAWESTEESKATYVFKAATAHLSDALQRIFDYLVSDVVNKRQTLIYSAELQRRLHLITRISHTSFPEWRLSIQPFCPAQRLRLPQ